MFLIARHMAVLVLVSTAFLGAQAQASDTPARTAQSGHPPIVWPDPTPAELEVLPRDGCKHLYDIKAPEKNSPEYLTWQYTDDGICWDWYKRHVDQSYLLGDTPPPGFDPARAAYYNQSEEYRRAREARKRIWESNKPGPAGSDPGPVAPRLNPVYE